MLPEKHRITAPKCFKVCFPWLRTLSISVLLVLSVNGLQAAEQSVRVGIYDFKPLVYRNAEGQPAGIYVDILEAIAQEEGWELEFVHGTWPQCLERLREGRIDILTGILQSEERDQHFDFNAVSILSTWGQLYTAPGQDVENFLDLEGKRIAVVKGGFFYPKLERMLKMNNVQAEFVEVEKYDRIFEMAQEGQADVCSAERVTGKHAASDYAIEKTPVIYHHKQFRVAAPEGEKGLLNTIDKHLKRFKTADQSVYQETLDRHWYGETSWTAIPAWVKWALLATVSVLVLALITIYYLRRIIRHRTAQLRQQGRDLRLTLQSIGDAVMATDEKGCITRMNPVAEDLTGWRFEAAQGKPMTEVFRIVEAYSRQPCEDPVEKVLDTGRLRGLANHTVLISYDGTEHQIADSASPVQDDAGRIIGVVVVFRDVSEIYRQQERLRQREELLARTQAIAHVGSWVLEVQDNHLKWSDEVYRIFGYEPQEFEPSYETFLNLIHPDDRAAVDAAYSDSLKKSEEGYEIEHRIIRADTGEVRHVYEKCVHECNDNGDVVRSVGMVQDVTDLRETEEARREHERTLSTLMGNLPGMAYRCKNTSEWPMAFVSYGAFALTGYTPEELTESQDIEFGDLIHPDDADSVWQKVQQSIAEDIQFQTEYRLYDKEGGEHWVWEQGCVVDRDQAGTEILEGFITDITERKHAEEERTLTLKLLQAMNSASDVPGLLAAVTQLIREWSGCDAVGVRLQEGKDYPYYETRGFPQEFVETERYLCEVDENGDYVCDREGNPVLECMCGNVIRGQTDPTLPLFTEKGSFWTNSTSELLASTSEEDRQGRTRNTCAEKGYETVVLIPLRYGSETLGLLQMNDGQRDRFTEREVGLLERLSDNLAVGLAHRRAADEWRKSEQKFRNIFENANDAIFIHDDRGQFREVNQIACKRLGYSRDELLQMKVQDIDSAPYAELAPQRIETIKEQGEMVFEHEHLSKQGAKLPVEISSRIIEYEGESMILSVARDISARKEAEKRQSELQEFLQSTMDALTSHIAVLDEEANVIAVNASWRRFAAENGLVWPDYGVGRNYLDAVDTATDAPSADEGADEAVDGIRSLLNRETDSFEVEYPCHSEDEQRWFRLQGTRFEISQGTRVVLSHENITQRKLAELELKQALDDLRKAREQHVEHERHRALAEMASGIAHDFNNALSPIQSFSALLLEQPEKLQDQDKALRYLRHIQDSASAAAETVRRMRKFYKPKEESTLGPVDLDHLIEEVVAVTEPRWKEEAKASGKSISITTDLKASSQVLGNEADLHEMLTNLIFNAVDAVPERGTIDMRTRQEEPWVVMEVSDNGVGMPEETRQKCLDPFYTTKGPSGSGLGLSTLQGVVQRHQGELRIESTEGEGTTFSIRLPLAQPSDGQSREAEQVPSVGKLRILAVEDEPMQQEVLADLLADEGHEVDVASDGAEGLSAFRENTYDVVITDRAMQEMSGDELAGKIKETAPGQPVIMVSGFGDIMDALNERPYGVDCLISKPFTRSSLRNALCEVVQ